MRYIAVILNFVALLFVAPIVGAQEATLRRAYRQRPK